MKYLIYVFLLLFSQIIYAYDINFKWDHDASSQEVKSYKLYHTEDKSKWVDFYSILPMTAGTLQGTQIAAPAKDTWFRVTAVNLAGESLPSNEVLFKFISIPNAPGSLIIILQ